MPPYPHKIFIQITIHHYFLGRIKNQNLVLGNLEMMEYNIHRSIMLCLSVMGKTYTPMNRKWYIWSCAWFKIKHNIYDRWIWVWPIYLIPSTILICTNRRTNLVQCGKLIMMIHPCSLQDFSNKPILIKMKSTIIQCIDFDT